ncbi:DUF4238 domain-containing protein [Siccirubricoccus phaeus]|uniref:DUF4238 domain-containing protein n=1 Tax=Siccirubricoccus phaeus TaxID=2595053 RepID=UPI00165CC878|nr:DUF4238 domain-containing protein [Siccirubricoccus phaeus]
MRLNLVGLLAVKNPSHREKFQDFQARLYKMMIDLVTSKDDIWNSQIEKAKKAGFLVEGSDVSREAVREFIRKGEYGISFSPGYNLTMELETFDKILPCFIDRRWTLLRAPISSEGFITSDHPVCLAWTDPKMANGVYPPGYGMRKTEIFFPISRRLAWVGMFEGTTRTVDVSDDFVHRFNAGVLDFAGRQVFGRSGECSYRRPDDARSRRLRDLPNDTRFQGRPGPKMKVRTALPGECKERSQRS